MSKADTPKREIERHVIRKLADPDLMKILEALRNLTSKEAGA